MLLDFCFKAIIAPPIVGTVVAMGLAGLTVRTTIGVVEFEARAVRTVVDYITSKGKTLPGKPKYPKAKVNVFLEELAEVDGDDRELPDLLETVEVKKEDGEGKMVVVRTKAKVNRHTRGRFVHRLVCATKNHLGGTPNNSTANKLVAYKFMVGKCKEQHLVETHTREVCSLAMAAIFTPDVHDVNMHLALNSHAAYRRRVALAQAQEVQSWQLRLLKHPLKYDSWERAWLWANGAPTQEPFRFIK
ncbi:p27 [Honeysuckle ringspot virus]|nr:p27 [Honeysuckle ringspot virus]ADV15467.1 p27 [Honeysuckle ringspot virus]